MYVSSDAATLVVTRRNPMGQCAFADSQLFRNATSHTIAKPREAVPPRSPFAFSFRSSSIPAPWSSVPFPPDLLLGRVSQIYVRIAALCLKMFIEYSWVQREFPGSNGSENVLRHSFTVSAAGTYLPRMTRRIIGRLFEPARFRRFCVSHAAHEWIKYTKANALHRDLTSKWR